LYYFILVLAFISFSTINAEDEFTFQGRIVKEKIVNEIQEKFGLKCNGIGAAAFQKNLSYYAFSFVDRSGEKDIFKARKLLLECAEIYFKHINSNELLRKYMVKYPFDFENCDICIYFEDSNKNTILEPYLCTAYIYINKFGYCIQDNPSPPYKSAMFESAEEAISKNNEYLKFLKQN
jgi:hypothetical protein